MLRFHIAYTLRRLRRNLLTQGLAITAVFELLLAKWATIQEQELAIEDEVDDSSLDVIDADTALNIFAQRVSNAILIITRNDRESPLYLHFFGDKPLHVFIKPILSGQLHAMRGWLPSLTGSEHAPLVALGAELPELLAKADLAATAKTDADQKRKDFREVGDRAKFVDEVNAARKEGHGVLGTMPHKHPGLPLNFADLFFKRDRTKKGEEVTVGDLDVEIDELKTELANKEALRAEMVEAAEEAAKKAAEDAAERDAAKVELSAIDKDMALKQKRAEELKAIIEAKS